MIWLLSACMTLDTLVHNPRHCTVVGESTCQDVESSWDKVCLPCSEEYDWQREYEWMDQTLAEGESIRPVADWSDHVLVTSDGIGELDIVVLESHGENPATAGLTLLYNHGNYAGIEHYAPRIRMLHEAGYRVVAWDYRGYGRSEPPSAPDGPTFLADASEVLDFTIGELDTDPAELVIYANSLGAIPAVEQSLLRPGCATVLEVPFPGITPTGSDATGLELPASLFTTGEYENTEKIRDYEGPLLVLVGELDDKFPVETERAFVDNAGGPAEFEVFEGAHHGISNVGVPETGFAEYAATIEDFLARHGCTP
ncbi:MAG: alpha/beta fold hydrolase [Proteobacteria bacterium]|nr:alpha/beta fold hydrolase [Pseudomonadota bacterium]MCP4917979.1 alpha/beta fold hydrolase [Pseudomonadota bacterium]